MSVDQPKNPAKREKRISLNKEAATVGLRAQSRSTVNPYKRLSGSATAYTSLSPPIQITVPANLTNTTNFILDYFSAYLDYNKNFVQDPFFQLGFVSGGQSAYHYFSAQKIATTASAPEGYQLYVISCPLQIAVDPSSTITFSAAYNPNGVTATVFVTLSGHFE